MRLGLGLVFVANRVRYGCGTTGRPCGFGCRCAGEEQTRRACRVAGNDCLHPINGAHGVSFVDQLIQHWLARAFGLWARARREQSRLLRRPWDAKVGSWSMQMRKTPALGKALEELPLPLPLHVDNAIGSVRPTRCFELRKRREDRVRSRLSAVWCSSEPRDTVASASPMQCILGDDQPNCPRDLLRDQATYDSFMANPPRSWFWCDSSLSPVRRKQSSGPVALVPGATLRISLDTFFGVRGGDLAPQRSLVAAVAPRVEHGLIRFAYLVSYKGMGTARIDCSAGCSCAPQTIDGVISPRLP